jgi:hypothetical protein
MLFLRKHKINERSKVAFGVDDGDIGNGYGKCGDFPYICDKYRKM